MPNPCPCGSEIQPGQEDLAYITQAIIDNVAATAAIPVVQLLDPLYGRAINLRKLCADPPPAPPTSLSGWFEDPISFLNDILRAVLAINWNLWCKCSDCPPVTGCGTGASIAIDQSDGYCPVSAQIPPPDPCAPCQVYYYVLPAGATYYAERSDGFCYGPYNGIEVRWPCDSFAPPGYVTVANADGSGPSNWLTSVYGTSVTLWTGGSGGGGPGYVWVDDGTTVEDPPVAPTCDDTTVCDAVDYIRDRVQVVERLLTNIAEALGITNASSVVTLPGPGGPITGTLAEIVAPALQWLLPVLPEQLTDPDPTSVSASGTIDVTGRDYVSIELADVPAYMGSRGTDARVYYSNARNPGPGWAILSGPKGVLSYHEVVYPAGLQLAIPPTSTDLSLEIAAGVAMTVTTYARSIVT